MPQKVTDMEFDEVSLVDRPANQHARIVLAKRAEQEDAMADEYFDANGDLVDIDSLEPGDVIQDAEGNLFEVEEQDDDDRELAEVGKSAFFAPEPDLSALAGLRDELSKAVANSDNEVLAKALGYMEAIEKRAVEAEARTAQLEQVAKREREIRLEREYIAKAAEYNVPIAAEDLGPVLMRCAEALSYDDCAVLHKALTAAGEMLFVEAGFDGQATNNDPLAEVEAYLEGEGEAVAKRAGEPVSKAQGVTAFFDDNPDAYEAFRASHSF